MYFFNNITLTTASCQVLLLWLKQMSHSVQHLSNKSDKTLHCRAEQQKGDNDMSVTIVLCLNVMLGISTFCALEFQH